MTPDLFPGSKPPRAKPRVMMHVCDAGDCIANFKCFKCGATSGWLDVANISEAKRGIPCEACNTHTVVHLPADDTEGGAV